MTIEQNIEDREWFEEMKKTVGPRFWELCREHSDTPLEMSSEEALAFGRTKMPFGMHEGIQIEQLNTDYLEYIADGVTWLRKLNEYLKHRKD